MKKKWWTDGREWLFVVVQTAKSTPIYLSIDVLVGICVHVNWHNRTCIFQQWRIDGCFYVYTILLLSMLANSVIIYYWLRCIFEMSNCAQCVCVSLCVCGAFVRIAVIVFELTCTVANRGFGQIFWFHSLFCFVLFYYYYSHFSLIFVCVPFYFVIVVLCASVLFMSFLLE